MRSGDRHRPFDVPVCPSQSGTMYPLSVPCSSKSWLGSEESSPVRWTHRAGPKGVSSIPDRTSAGMSFGSWMGGVVDDSGVAVALAAGRASSLGVVSTPASSRPPKSAMMVVAVARRTAEGIGRALASAEVVFVEAVATTPGSAVNRGR